MSQIRPATGKFDLTGVWSGVFSTPRRDAPTAFTARLDETLGWVLGTA